MRRPLPARLLALVLATTLLAACGGAYYEPVPGPVGPIGPPPPPPPPPIPYGSVDFDNLSPEYMLGFYIGGMGARQRNFHAELLSRMGFEEAVRKVQDLFFAGKRDEAAAAVPDQLADELSLVGPPERIRDRLQAWKESPVTTILAGTREANAVRALAEAL